MDLNLDVRQNIYDGGITKQVKELEEAKDSCRSAAGGGGSLWIKGAGLISTILQSWSFRTTGKTWRSIWRTWYARQEAMRTAIDNGTLLEADLNVIEVEVLKIKQSILEIDSRKQALIGALNVLCGTTLGSQVADCKYPDLEGYSMEADQPAGIQTF